MSDAMERLATGEYARAVENRGGSGMTDNLVAMARLAQRDERMSTGALYGDLADRIEELEAKLDDTAWAVWMQFKHWDGEKKFALREAVKFLKGDKHE